MIVSLYPAPARSSTPVHTLSPSNTILNVVKLSSLSPSSTANTITSHHTLNSFSSSTSLHISATSAGGFANAPHPNAPSTILRQPFLHARPQDHSHFLDHQLLVPSISVGTSSSFIFGQARLAYRRAGNDTDDGEICRYFQVHKIMAIAHTVPYHKDLSVRKWRPLLV